MTDPDVPLSSLSKICSCVQGSRQKKREYNRTSSLVVDKYMGLYRPPAGVVRLTHRGGPWHLCATLLSVIA